jgi:Co/Zn/Cd efflux system component
MSETQQPSSLNERRTLLMALAVNAAMAAVEGTAGWLAESTGLLADGLDMLSDAMAYAIALVAVGESHAFKQNAARLSGTVLFVLGLGVLVESGRRAIYGSEPVGALMITVGLLALIANITVLRLLQPFRAGEVHLRATWIFTRADVVANLGVIVAAALVA